MNHGVAAGPVTRRLGFQIAFILAIVLLPLTLISILRSSALAEEARARSEAALMGETMQAVARETQFIQEARGTVAALASASPSFVDDLETCNQIMREIAAESERYSLVAFIPTDGIMRCSSSGKVHDFNDSALWHKMNDASEPIIVVNRSAPISGTSVLGISHPVFDANGVRLGSASVSVPHVALRTPVESDNLFDQPIEIVTFNIDGEVLSASGWTSGYEGALPADRSLKALAGDEPLAFSAQSESGVSRVFSVVPLVPGKLYALGTWPAGQGLSLTQHISAEPYVFPILMWLASLIVAWLAVERQVISHVRKLRNSLISFAGGDRLVGDIDVSGAALEIREIADAYESMTETILRDEAELEDMVHQKEVLLREVHHRVKNNLQLIASIMNMQMRRTRSPEAKQMLRGLQDRVMSLATIHRELYQTVGLSDIHSDELLATIVRQITNMTDRPDRRFSVHTEFAGIQITPDQAVPLALFVAEAVTNAIKYASGAGEQNAELWVTLTRTSETRAMIRIKNTVGAEAVAAPGDDLDVTGDERRPGLGTQLLSAFAMQLGGVLEQELLNGVYDLKVEFELRPLEGAEERNVIARGQEPEPVG